MTVDELVDSVAAHLDKRHFENVSQMEGNLLERGADLDYVRRAATWRREMYACSSVAKCARRCGTRSSPS